VIASVSTGVAGVADRAVTVRSGFAAGVPMTWNSATCPPGAPVFAVKCSRMSAAVAATGTVTVLPDAGLNEYVAGPTSVVNADPLCSRPRTENVWVRGPQALSGFSFTTTDCSVALAPSRTVRSAGCPPPSQYVAVLVSLALAATNVNTVDDASIGLPAARLSPEPAVNGRPAARFGPAAKVDAAAAGVPGACRAAATTIVAAVVASSRLNLDMVGAHLLPGRRVRQESGRAAIGGRRPPPFQEGWTSNSETWPAGQPVLPVNCSRR
jgi:hypothetical protein